MHPLNFLRVGAAGAEIVTVAEAKAQLRVTHAFDDAYITSLIPVAREFTEDYVKRSLVAQTWQVGYEGWPCGSSRILELCRPVPNAIVSLKYQTSAEEVTLDAGLYSLDKLSTRGAVVLKKAFTFPTLSADFENKIVVEFTTLPDSSELYKSAIKLVVAHLYNNRSAASMESLKEMPLGFADILRLKILPNSL